MRQKLLLAAILVDALTGAVLYFYGDGQAPPGQAPLQNLTAANLAGIKNSFNTAKDDVRVLLLLSPT